MVQVNTCDHCHKNVSVELAYVSNKGYFCNLACANSKYKIKPNWEKASFLMAANNPLVK